MNDQSARKSRPTDRVSSNDDSPNVGDVEKSHRAQRLKLVKMFARVIARRILRESSKNLPENEGISSATLESRRIDR